MEIYLFFFLRQEKQIFHCRFYFIKFILTVTTFELAPEDDFSIAKKSLSSQKYEYSVIEIVRERWRRQTCAII